MKKHIHSIDKQALDRIHGHGRGWVFAPADFFDLGRGMQVASALKRYKKSGIIRQLARGLYDYPRNHPKLGMLSPSIDAIASALKGRDAVRIQPSGAYAANRLGLSDQVPMKAVFLTDGSSKTVQIGNQQIILKHTTPRNMATAGRISGLLIQALRHLGQAHVDADIIAKLDSRLDGDARKQLIRDVHYAPAWIAVIFRKLADGGNGK